MSERKREVFTVEIADQTFQLNFQTEDHSLLKCSKKVLKPFSNSSGKNYCDVEVIPYSSHQIFPWKPSELEIFRDYFLKIARRFPVNDQPEKIADSSLGIIKCLDPEEEKVKRIQSGIDKKSILIYSSIMSDIYFFDTESMDAFFFIKRSHKRSHMASGIMNGLMFLLSHLLIQNKGILIHGAAIQRDSRTVLFLGLSGAGKSTVTDLCQPDVCFSDDGAVLKMEGDRLFVYRSPFTQMERHDNYPELAKGEVEKIFLLEKGNNHNILPIRKSSMMITMLISLIHFFKYLDDETALTGFYVVKEILNTVPSYRLEFAKKGKVWEKIISN
jgi:hypothetical protein